MSMGYVGNSAASAQWQDLRGTQRPDPAQLAQKLFQQLDTSGQGYLSKTDLQAAMDKVTLSPQGIAASNAASGTSATSVDALMAKLDANGDGKVTKEEFASALKSAAQQMHGHRGHHAHSAQGGERGGDHDGDADDAPSAASGAGASTAGSSATDTDHDSARALMQVMRMLRAYQASNDTSAQSQSTATTTATTQGASATA